MSDLYRLKYKINKNALDYLNIDNYSATNFYAAIRSLGSNEDRKLGEDGYVDLVHAAFSGKKIVNPMSPREEMEIYYADQEDAIKYPIDMEGRIRAIAIRKGIKKAVEIIAKEHPDVAGWLKDGETND